MNQTHLARAPWQVPDMFRVEGWVMDAEMVLNVGIWRRKLLEVEKIFYKSVLDYKNLVNSICNYTWTNGIEISWIKLSMLSKYDVKMNKNRNWQPTNALIPSIKFYLMNQPYQSFKSSVPKTFGHCGDVKTCKYYKEEENSYMFCVKKIQNWPFCSTLTLSSRLK